MANPSTELPPVKNETTDSSEFSNDLSRMESLSISEQSDQSQNRVMNKIVSSATLFPFSLQMGYHMGPYDDEKMLSIYTLGADIQYAFDPSEKAHVGLLIANKSNPFIYISRESYLRNYWRYLKSWSYLVELEVDSKQGLGAFLSFNRYSIGAGMSFSLSSNIDLHLNLLPISSRGASGEVLISYLTF